MIIIKRILLFIFATILVTCIYLIPPTITSVYNYKSLTGYETSDIDSLKKKYANNEVVAKLYIASLNIDIPVMQHDDNKYYLKHDVYGNIDKYGSIFLDYRNNVELDRKLIIFGHNSNKEDTTFKKLEKYLNKNFYEEKTNRIIVLKTSNKKAKYEIKSVYIENSDFQHMKLNFTKKDWIKHVNFLNDSSFYKNAKISYEDSLLVLQTCYYKPKNSYLLLVATKIEEEYL